MRKRVFWSILVVSLFTLILTSSLVILVLYRDFSDERKQELVTQALYISKALNRTDKSYLSEIGKNSQSRITLISADGSVFYDNFADAAKLENHLSRPEVAGALKNGSGEATRQSKSIGERTYYYAVRLDNGDILRVSITTNSIFGVIGHTIAVMALIVLLALLFAVISARLFTKTIIIPINRLNLDHPLANNTYDELTPLLSRMDRQNKKINEQIQELEAKQTELNAITENMNEALVIFSEDRHVLFSNKSANILFENYRAEGVGYLELFRDMGYIRCVESAFAGESANEIINKDGKVYQLTVNPVHRNDTNAAVLFAVDITGKEQIERMRREFSANVSHELKTPLTSIMGYAEIMMNGIAKPEDFSRFTGQIYAESKRLLTIIDDVIRLSRLDEKSMMNEFRKVDLYTLSQKIIRELRSKAESNEITLSLEGKHLSVSGIEEVLHEIIFNLCDNAITYNKKGGSVSVLLSEQGGHCILSVQDTGVGIPPEHQTRIFERFYRVDKSRSKETGGTGLGLSIVKHGAMLHNAEISLESTIGEGTTIRLVFQKQAAEKK